MRICNINNNNRITLSTDNDVFIASIYAGVDYQTMVKVSYSSGNLALVDKLEHLTLYLVEVKETVNNYWNDIAETNDPRDMIIHLLQVCIIADKIYNNYNFAEYE